MGNLASLEPWTVFVGPKPKTRGFDCWAACRSSSAGCRSPAIILAHSVGGLFGTAMPNPRFVFSACPQYPSRWVHRHTAHRKTVISAHQTIPGETMKQSVKGQRERPCGVLRWTLDCICSDCERSLSSFLPLPIFIHFYVLRGLRHLLECRG